MKIVEERCSEHGMMLRSHVMLEDRVEVEELEIGREERPEEKEREEGVGMSEGDETRCRMSRRPERERKQELTSLYVATRASIGGRAEESACIEGVFGSSGSSSRRRRGMASPWTMGGPFSEREEGGEKSRTYSIEPFQAWGYDPPLLHRALSLRLRGQACLDLLNLSSNASEEEGCLVEDEEKEEEKEESTLAQGQQEEGKVYALLP